MRDLTRGREAAVADLVAKRQQVLSLLGGAMTANVTGPGCT